jgi:hypothetical protein
MMRLVLAPKSTEGIKEKLLQKSGENTLKITKKKNDPYNLETRFMHKD